MESVVSRSSSGNLNELFSALSKAQGEMKPAELNAVNPFFKSNYSDLSEIVRVSRPALSKNGLCVIQQIMYIEEDNTTVVNTVLAHSSGQYIESRMKINPAKPDIQSFASCVTYAKRYAYASLVGVVSSEEDDDGEMDVSSSRNGTRPAIYEKITREQLEQLNYELQDHPALAKRVKEGLNLNLLSDMPKARFIDSINRIREMKTIEKNIS